MTSPPEQVQWWLRNFPRDRRAAIVEHDPGLIGLADQIGARFQRGEDTVDLDVQFWTRARAAAKSLGFVQ